MSDFSAADRTASHISEVQDPLKASPAIFTKFNMYVGNTRVQERLIIEPNDIYSSPISKLYKTVTSPNAHLKRIVVHPSPGVHATLNEEVRTFSINANGRPAVAGGIQPQSFYTNELRAVVEFETAKNGILYFDAATLILDHLGRLTLPSGLVIQLKLLLSEEEQKQMVSILVPYRNKWNTNKLFAMSADEAQRKFLEEEYAAFLKRHELIDSGLNELQ